VSLARRGKAAARALLLSAGWAATGVAWMAAQPPANNRVAKSVTAKSAPTFAAASRESRLAAVVTCGFDGGFVLEDISGFSSDYC
jgi:hypothetical protein